VIDDAHALGPDACQLWWASPAHRAEWHDGLLDQAEARRRDLYLSAADRDRFTVGAALTRLVLAGLLGVDPAGVPVRRTCAQCGDAHGRPRLATEAIDFSISHSGDLIVLAVTRSQAADGASRTVGVDVERIAPGPDEELADVVLSAAERITFDRLEGSARTGAFFRYWVRKEALLKATGDGLAVPMKHLTMSGPDQPPRLAHWLRRPDLAAGVSTHDLHAGPGYVAALAFVGRDATVTCHDAGHLLGQPSSLPV
jgi:4'-phosphopantetheinyl transferase